MPEIPAPRSGRTVGSARDRDGGEFEEAVRAGGGCGPVCRNAGCGQDPARAWGALGLRKGGGSCGVFQGNWELGVVRQM